MFSVRVSRSYCCDASSRRRRAERLTLSALPILRAGLSGSPSLPDPFLRRDERRTPLVVLLVVFFARRLFPPHESSTRVQSLAGQGERVGPEEGRTGCRGEKKATVRASGDRPWARPVDSSRCRTGPKGGSETVGSRESKGSEGLEFLRSICRLRIVD